jgi:hypothetical protein
MASPSLVSKDPDGRSFTSEDSCISLKGCCYRFSFNESQLTNSNILNLVIVRGENLVKSNFK